MQSPHASPSPLESPEGNYLSAQLAPLQQLMLADTLAKGVTSGTHVEQVEIHFIPEISQNRIEAAWRATVMATEALRVAFSGSSGIPDGYQLAKGPTDLTIEREIPTCWEAWREAARQHNFLDSHSAPWIASYWPDARRFIWTFHHALLDGRSIARILRNFLQNLHGQPLAPLALTTWRSPTHQSIDVAETYFQTIRPHLARPLFPLALEIPTKPADPRRACHHLGAEFAHSFATTLATQPELSAPTVLIWTWGQTICQLAGVESVVVEQVRCGASPHGEAGAGFTMTTFPVLIRRADDGNLLKSLRDFRRDLREIRAIETVSERDLAPSHFPDLSAAACSVIMVERGSLRHLIGESTCCGVIESIHLNEPTSEWPTASGYIFPTMQLEVEGPGRHDLLEKWITCLHETLPLIRDAAPETNAATPPF